MSYRYLVLAATGTSPDALEAFRFTDALAAEGLKEQRARSRPFRLFASDRTPVLQTPGGGYLIGHLFSRDGTAIVQPSQLPAGPNARALQRHIVEQCWGEYVLIQPADGEAAHPGFDVLRSPSASAECPCLHLQGDGGHLVTSHLSLASFVTSLRREVDWDFIVHRLMYPDAKTERTGLAGVHELLPGCTLTLDGAELSAGVAWSPWSFVSDEYRHRDLQDAGQDVRQAVSTVVEAMANVDRDILLELSGGLDSSIVGVCLKSSPARIVCSSLVAAPGADERRYASQIADVLGLDLHIEALQPENAREAFPLHPDILCARIGPLQFAIDQMMNAAANRHSVASFCSGGGGDVVFCYLRTAAPAADAVRERGIRAGLTTIRALAELHQSSVWNVARLTLKKLARAPRPARVPDRSFLATGLDAIPDLHPWLRQPAHAYPGDRERIAGLATAQVYRDGVPRSMRRHLRFPLLAQPVMEACLRAPSWMWVSGGLNRAVARMAYADMLPAAIHGRRSKGTFTGYLGNAYRGSQSRIRTHLLSGQLATRGLLDIPALEAFFQNDPNAHDSAFARVLDLCAVKNWLRNQVIT